ncbi:MAG TPA: hypothetical protein G4O00_08295 [Thermoflexia bacterium]|jgi:predicted regulator of Ras-like GTPase activity (Roadblock/LC7/MglB family)|nr:hypothetical protein [Thermoflexia bacterium]
MTSAGPNPENDARIPSKVAEGVQRVLAALRRSTTAQGVLLVDGEGQVVAEAGRGPEERLGEVLPVLSDEVGVTQRLEEGWAGEPVISLHYYEGSSGQIYAAAGGDFPYLLVVLTKRHGLPPSGVTWLFVRRALQELRALLRSSRMEPEIGEVLGVVEAERRQG